MEENPYESTMLLGEYLLFHYGKEDEVLPWSKGPVEALGFTTVAFIFLFYSKSFVILVCIYEAVSAAPIEGLELSANEKF